jgi:hypothetical protein
MNRPWFAEDNKVDFDAEGFKCCLRRGPMGSWCGYVGVPSTHPWFGKGYSDEVKPTADMLGPRDADDHGPIDVLCMALSGKDPAESLPITLCVRVHGGLTYAYNHDPYGKPDGLWWFGFDCAHSGDLVPALYERYPHHTDVYRDQSYVVAECQSLAAQLRAIGERS